MTTSALDFFISTVKPTVSEFLNDPYDIRLGRLAAIVLNHMADYWCWYLYNNDEKLADTRNGLTIRCPDFAVIRDIADASKHHKLKRGTKQLTSSEQITRPPGLFQAPFGIGVFAEASKVIFRLDNGTEVTARPTPPPPCSAVGVWPGKGCAQAMLTSGLVRCPTLA
ncbi:MAG: hypothetical protein ACREFA_19160, partial [Stellaceae bacterium]